MSTLFARIRDLLRRRQVVSRFDEEMEFHLAELTAEFERKGFSPVDARAAAQREFGNVVQSREALRELSSLPRLEAMMKDLVFCARGLARRPFFTLCAVGILALGLAAATLIYSLIDSVFLKPLPVPAPEELHLAMNAEGTPGRFSYGTASRFAQLSASPSAGYSGSCRMTAELDNGTPESALVRLVTGTFFQTLKLNAASGRVLHSADDVVGDPRRVAVVSHAWAKSHFAQPPEAVGRTLLLNRQSFTIVGVLPRGFTDITLGPSIDFWMPAADQSVVGFHGNANTIGSSDRTNNPDWSREERVAWLELLVRVRPEAAAAVGPTLAQAFQTERADRSAALDDPQEREALGRLTWTMMSSPGGFSWFRPTFQRTALLLGSIAGVMLILGIANVSGLLLVRTLSRHRELGVRLALGSGLVRAIRLPFLETTLVGCISWLTGGMIAAVGIEPLQALVAPGQILEHTISAKCWLVCGLLATAASLGSSIVPALWILKLQPLSALSGRSSAGPGTLRMGNLLVTMQLALAVLLVALANALGSELRHTLASSPGFDRVHVLTARFEPVVGAVDRDTLDGMTVRIRQAALEVPGVRAVGFSGNGILSGSTATSGIHVRSEQAKIRSGQFQLDSVSAEYLQAAGLQVLQGRLIGNEDQENTVRSAVVSASFARRIFGEANPLGQRFGFNVVTDKDDWTIVGIIADARVNGMREETPAVFYAAATQWWYPPSFLAVRCEGDAAKLGKAVREAVRKAEPAVVFSDWNTLDERVTDDLADNIAAMRIAAIAAAVALLLAAAGMAASLGHLVALRRREIAIRMAVGAGNGRVLRDVVKRAVRLGGAGALIGVVAVAILVRLPVLQTLLYEKPGAAPAIVAALAGMAVSIVASLAPAWRASRTNPLELLKSE
ncbi:hypothetical protein DB347_14035 [Opitutaceae bacterium EW11]|nr:hypothetical protein DB347_14035 [Opitutaceae bacterium EW11]